MARPGASKSDTDSVAGLPAMGGCLGKQCSCQSSFMILSNYFSLFHVARITAGLPDRPPSPPGLRITRSAVLMPGHRLLWPVLWPRSLRQPEDCQPDKLWKPVRHQHCQRLLLLWRRWLLFVLQAASPRDEGRVQGQQGLHQEGWKVLQEELCPWRCPGSGTVWQEGQVQLLQGSHTIHNTRYLVNNFTNNSRWDGPQGFLRLMELLWTSEITDCVCRICPSVHLQL